MGATHDPAAWADEQFTYLTTTGRTTGNAHTIEIWFALDPQDATRLCMMAGSGWKADWVRNLAMQPVVTLKLGTLVYPATAVVVAGDHPDEGRIRELLAAKYQGWRAGQPLSEWARTALPVACVLDPGGVRPAE